MNAEQASERRTESGKPARRACYDDAELERALEELEALAVALAEEEQGEGPFRSTNGMGDQVSVEVVRG
jgi:hypothetical protein